MTEFTHNNDNDNHKITKDEVVAKLKDDGDFDKLRLNIIRKLKDDEELRENLRSIVRESGAINLSGSENMKPRQLSDAIYQEVGEKLNARISDGLWAIIRSSDDGMKSEIVETVRSVYDRLIGPNGVSNEVLPIQVAESNGHDDPIEPPGFSQQRLIDGVHTENKNFGDCCNDDDEDPDLPPGFG